MNLERKLEEIQKAIKLHATAEQVAKMIEELCNGTTKEVTRKIIKESLYMFADHRVSIYGK